MEKEEEEEEKVVLVVVVVVVVVCLVGGGTAMFQVVVEPEVERWRGEVCTVPGLISPGSAPAARTVEAAGQLGSTGAHWT